MSNIVAFKKPPPPDPRFDNKDLWWFILKGLGFLFGDDDVLKAEYIAREAPWQSLNTLEKFSQSVLKDTKEFLQESLKPEFMEKASQALIQAWHDDWFDLHTGVALAAFFSHKEQGSIVAGLVSGRFKSNMLNKVAAFLWRLDAGQEPEPERFLEFAVWHTAIGYYDILVDLEEWYARQTALHSPE